MNKPILSIVVPCYNEQEILPISIKQLLKLLSQLIVSNLISKHSYLCFIDDGSKDKTWKIIKQYSQSNSNIKGIKLSNNVGHQNALLAGLKFSIKNSDCIATIDADLQDDETVIKEMVEYYTRGYHVIYGVRDDRKTDSYFKKNTAELFYKLMNLMGVKLIFNHADFRLLSKVAVNNFLKYKERNLFIRGIIPLIGFKSTNVYYKRKKREAGDSKYPLLKMISFAWGGITSFSVKPLKFITFTGFVIFILSIIMGAYSLYVVLFTTNAIQGWASTILPIYFLGGIQLLSIGILGEYIGKIYNEIKHRPRFHIEEYIESP